MKKSKIMLLGGAGFLLLILLVLISLFRISAEKFMNLSYNARTLIDGAGIIGSKDYKFRNFNALSFESVWEVIVIEGDDFGINLTADEALLKEIEVSQSGKTVTFSYDKFLRSNSDKDYPVKAQITIPDLKRVDFKGMGSILLKNFTLDELNIDNAGASNFEAENVSIKQLNLIVQGAANARLFNINVENCNLDISGAANIEINMNGGVLSGKISGAASVVYKGIVSEESVSISGIGHLERQ
ncbi:MAG: DUF2807 domain-containing protein [Spirochaetaceae bacterium]|nr:DUF2807 domain-containing protein [Spirochaetaceae bacterium]